MSVEGADHAAHVEQSSLLLGDSLQALLPSPDKAAGVQGGDLEMGNTGHVVRESPGDSLENWAVAFPETWWREVFRILDNESPTLLAAAVAHPRFFRLVETMWAPNTTDSPPPSRSKRHWAKLVELAEHTVQKRRNVPDREASPILRTWWNCEVCEFRVLVAAESLTKACDYVKSGLRSAVPVARFGGAESGGTEAVAFESITEFYGAPRRSVFLALGGPGAQVTRMARQVVATNAKIHGVVLLLDPTSRTGLETLRAQYRGIVRWIRRQSWEYKHNLVQVLIVMEEANKTHERVISRGEVARMAISKKLELLEGGGDSEGLLIRKLLDTMRIGTKLKLVKAPNANFLRGEWICTGLLFRDKLHADRFKAAGNVLCDLGWEQASPHVREWLALNYARRVLYPAIPDKVQGIMMHLRERPKDWAVWCSCTDPSFTRPTVTFHDTTRSVKVRMWVRSPPGTFSWIFRLVEIHFSGEDGSILNAPHTVCKRGFILLRC